MAIKIVSKDILVCDICGNETFVTVCLGCGVAHCWQCIEKYGSPYKYRFVSDRTGTLYFCRECDARIPQNAESLYAACKSIAILREESTEWHRNFEKRKKNAEQKLDVELKKKFPVMEM